ncbi:TonB family protein [Colwellia sp. D2M02]|nr:TonB family protein [Colwellia sp. D2M02]
MIISLCITFSFSTKADLLSATLAYNNGNYQQAHYEFQRLAKLGHKDAIYNIGVMYLYGQGVEKDLISAHSWFSLAADYGLEEARSAARLIEQELKGDKAQQIALTSSLKALNQSLSFELYTQTLQPVFNEKKYTNHNNQPPLRVHTVDAIYPKEAYEKGIEGWVWLEFDVDKSGAVKDVDIIDAFPDKTFNRSIYNAVRRWRYEPFRVDGQLANYGSRSLLYHFTTFKGKRYQASFAHQKKDYQKKINLLIEGAEQGNALIQYYIANWLVADEYNATRLLRFHWQQETASSDLLLESAINGYPNSQYRLGTNLLRGEYTKTDRKKGINWILNAAQSGFVYAQYRLARELLDQRHIEYDKQKAKRWLESAAKQNHFRALRDLINLELAEKNYQRANSYIIQALKLDDEHPDLLFAQAKVLANTQQSAKAKVILTLAIKEAKARQWYFKEIEEYLTTIS